MPAIFTRFTQLTVEVITCRTPVLVEAAQWSYAGACCLAGVGAGGP
jgi:hypothetical protein